MELIDILTVHAKRYPLMQPCDIVKLIYQNEFGGGHLISDETQCLERLKNEYKKIQQLNHSLLYEDIGNGMIRVNLAALNTDIYPIDKLNHDFIESSKKHRGNTDSFLEKICLLQTHFNKFSFSFTLDEFNAYFSEYESAGFPPVSHSEKYRNAYSPAYRIIRKR